MRGKCEHIVNSIICSRLFFAPSRPIGWLSRTVSLAYLSMYVNNYMYVCYNIIEVGPFVTKWIYHSSSFLAFLDTKEGFTISGRMVLVHVDAGVLSLLDSIPLRSR